MSQLVCPYIKLEIDRAIKKLVTVIPDNEANYLRGYIKACGDLLDMPQIIKNRMNYERDNKETLKQFEKELM